MNEGNAQERAVPTDYQLLALDKPTQIHEVLTSLQICDSSERVVEIAKAGEGNMNLVLRIKTDRQSIIVKQARPWVEKYPVIAAPDERIHAEIDFYQNISQSERVKTAMPRILATDADQRIMVLEDLGASRDYASLYSPNASDQRTASVFEQAIDWLSLLHQCKVAEQDNPGCYSLRELNFQHIFAIPLHDPPAIDLDEVCVGLTESSRAICKNDGVLHSMNRLGDRYLKKETGGKLLHGDFYPGSWLETESGFRVIDPEFCFRGPVEFDLGVVAAHWIFCGGTPSQATIDRVCERYHGKSANGLVTGFAGAELIRRLVGVAQLPLAADLKQRSKWLACGVEFLEQFAGQFADAPDR